MVKDVYLSKITSDFANEVCSGGECERRVVGAGAGAGGRQMKFCW